MTDTVSLEHPKIGEYSFPIEAYLTDYKGQVTLSSLGNYLLHAATEHADQRGFGYENMVKQHRVWVLSRLAIEMNEYPVAGNLLHVQTWVEEVNKLFTLRNFAFLVDGKEIGFARSVWASIDMESRHPGNLFELGNIADYVCDKNCPIDKVSKIKPLAAMSVVDTYRVRYSDLDINKHVNSVKYIEHMVDLFPLAFLEKREVKRFEIAYLNESHYGDVWNIYQQQTEGAEEYLIELRNEKSEVICRSRFIYK